MHLESRAFPVAASPHMHQKTQVRLRKGAFDATQVFRCALTQDSRNFWCRCAFGKHPFPSRTRRLRLKRPMILYWRRYGKAGGCQAESKLMRASRKAKPEFTAKPFATLSESEPEGEGRGQWSEQLKNHSNECFI